MTRNPRRWHVAGYYADDVAPPKSPGDLAIEVAHVSKSGADLEAEILRDRDDIGDVIVTPPADR